jgi:hypothetical protein
MRDYLGFVRCKCLRENPGDGIESDCLDRRTDDIERRKIESSLAGHDGEVDAIFPLAVSLAAELVRRRCKGVRVIGVSACSSKTADAIRLIILKIPGTAVLSYCGSSASAFY